MTKKKAIIASLLTIILFSSIYFIYNQNFAKNELISIAEPLLTRLLTIPDPSLKQAYDSFSATASTRFSDSDSPQLIEIDSDEIDSSMSKLLGDCVTKEFAESGERLNGLLSLHYSAMAQNYTMELEELTISESSQDHLLIYDAVLTAQVPGKSGQTIHINGKVQFDSQNKVSAITAGGRELTAFNRSLIPKY